MKTETLEKEYKYFDLNDFEVKNEKATATIQVAENLEEANTLLENEANLINAANAFARAKSLAVAENSVTSKGGKKSIVFAVIRPFRDMPPFNTVGATKDEKGAYVKDSDGNIIIDKKKQTRAILEMVKKSEEMIQSIREASAAAAGTVETETESNDE